MSYRKRRAFRALEDPIRSVTVSARQVETLLAALLLPVVPREEWTQAATDALVSFVQDQGIPEFTMDLSADRQMVTFSPPAVLNALERAGGYAFTALSPMMPAGSGSWGELLLKTILLRHAVFPLSLKLALYGEFGIEKTPAQVQFDRWVTSVEVLSRTLAGWIEETPSIRNGISIKGEPLGMSWEDAVNVLREPFPRVTEGESLGAAPALVAGGILVGILIVAVVVGIYLWQEPARLDAERQLVEAETEFESVKTINQGIESGLAPDQIAQLLNPIAELRDRRPPPSPAQSTALIWILGGAALVGAAVYFVPRFLGGRNQPEVPA